jgi:hypothetical protein
VQSGATVKVAVSDLTAARAVSALSLTLTSTDASATAAPLLDLYRDSASPAVSDTLGEIEFNGEDSAGNKQAYGLIHASILSPTSTAEQGQIHFETATAGALTEKMIIGTTNLVINEIGAVFNVRIEGDGEANLFYTDATNDRIGVGTATPGYRLDVTRNGGGGDNAQIARITDSNTSNSLGPLHLTVGATNHFAGNAGMVLAGTNGIGLAVGDGSDLAAQRKLTIDSSGNVLIGATSNPNNAKVVVDFAGGSSSSRGLIMNSGSTASTAMIAFQNPNGYAQGEILTSGTTTSYNIVSDYRLKENVTPMTGALEKVVALKPCTYTWKVDGSSGQGFIAHELQAVIPDCVTGKKDAVETVDDFDIEGKKIGTKEVNRYQGMDTSFLVATLVSAIQELKAEIDLLKAR